MRYFVTGKQHIGAKRHLFSAPVHDLHRPGPFGEMPLFIEFVVVGKEGLGDQAQQFAPVQHRCRIVQFAPDLSRQSDEDQCLTILGFLTDAPQLFLCLFQQTALQKQIPAGIRCQRQLRKHHDLYMLFFAEPDLFQNLICIKHRIRHPDFRGDRCYFDKSVVHRHSSLAVSVISFCLLHGL